MAGLAGQAYGQPPFGTVIKNRGTVTFDDKSGVSASKQSNEVRTPVNPSLVKRLESAADTLMPGDQLIYQLIIDNRGGGPVSIALRDTIDSILEISTVIGNAAVQVSGQVVMADWTPYDADRVDTIRVVAFLRNRDVMPEVVRNQAWLMVSGVLMPSDIIEVPIKSIGRTADGEIEQPEYVVPGEDLLVTVRDEDLNTSPNVVEEVVVTVTNTRSGERETVVLRATGPDSDEFTGTVPTKLNLNGVGANNDGIMHVQPADPLRGVYHDERTAEGPPADRTDVTIVLPTRITLEPNPRTLVGNGTDQSILTARVTDSLGRPLPDGTPITFYTDKGKISYLPSSLDPRNNQVGQTGGSVNALIDSSLYNQQIVVPVIGGNGEAQVLFTAPVLDASTVANVFASFGGYDSDIIHIEVLPGAVGIRVFDQVRGLDVTSLDDELVVEITIFGTTATGQPFGPITVTLDVNGLFSSDLLPPGDYTFVTRVVEIETGRAVLENDPQRFIVNFDGSVTPPKNSIAGTIRPRGHTTGEQFAGLHVQLVDADGNVVGETITNESGGYEFEGLDPGLYTLRTVFADGSIIDTPIDQRSRLVGQIVVNVDVLIDPFGQTFDAVTNVVVSGTTVAIETLDGQVVPLPPLNGTGAAPNVDNVNPYVTVFKGQFAFLFGGNQVGTFGSPAAYQMTVVPPVGSDYLPRRFFIDVEPQVSGPIRGDTPIRLTARSADGLELAHPNSFSLTSEEVHIANIAVIALNIPLFKTTPILQLAKSTVEDTLGTNVPFDYIIAVANTGNEVAQGVTIADTLNPQIWRLIEAPGASIPAPNVAVWSIGDLQPGERDTVRLRVEILPPQVNGLMAINTAVARMNRGFPVKASSGVIVSSPIRATAITLDPDPKTIVGNGTDFSYLTARVVDNENQPLPDGTPVRFVTDQGTFENGQQQIVIPISGGNGEAVAVFIAPVLTENDTANVFATFDNVASNTVNLEVLPGAVGVRVFDQVRGIEIRANDPAYRVEVSLVGRSATGEPIAYTVMLDANGVFAIPDIPPGTYQLKAIVTEVATGKVVSDGKLQAITVNFDGSTSQPKNAISGTVRGRNEKTGARFAGLTVQLLDESGAVIATAVLDEEGNYDFQGLNPGRYSVRFILPDGAPVTLPVHSRSRLSGSIVINVNVLIDPYGQTYDAVTHALIPDIRVSLETPDGQVLPLPPLSGTGALPNTNNDNPFITDTDGRFAFLFGGNQVGTFGNPVTYLLKATPPDTTYLPRTLRIAVQPANPGPITSDSPISITVTSGDVLEIAKLNSFTLTRTPQTAGNIAVVAVNIPMFKTAPFLEMTKTARPDSVVPGTQTRFDIVLSNTGNEPALNVTVVDTLSSDWRLIAGSPGGQIVAPNVVRWTIPSMAPGRVDTLWLQAELIPPQLNGTVLTNTAHATTPRGINVDATEKTTVGSSPTWVIHIRPLVDLVGPGDEIPWIIRLKNIGTEVAHNFVMTDTIPTTHTPVWVINGEGDTTSVPGSLRPLNQHLPFMKDGVITGQAIRWPMPDFAPGQEDSAMFVTRTIDTLPPRTIIEDFSYILGPGNQVWAASAAALASRGPKLELIKEATRDTVSVGETVEFRIITRNNEKVPTIGAITLIDSLPASMQLVSAPQKTTVSGNVLSWTVAPLAPGQADTLSIFVKILGDEGPARNEAILRYFSEELRDDATVNVKPAPTLAVTKSADKTLVEPGEEVEYTITLAALGDTVTAITVTDTLPRVLAYVRGSSQPAAAYDSLGHILTWTVPAVLPGTQATLTFRMKPTAGLGPGEHPARNIAVAAPPDTTVSSDPVDLIVSVPFFVITKATDQSVVETGDFVIYRLTLENLSANDDLTNLRVWDRLPHSFKYIDGTTRLDGQPLEPESVIGRDVIWRIADLPARQIRQLTYRVVVGSDALSGDGTNVVHATATAPSGNTASAGPAKATVRIRPDVFSQSQVIIGRAWIDDNENGLQDDGEPPVPGVAFLMEDGTRIVADQNGRFSVPEIRSGAHVLRLLEKNVPADLTPIELGVRSARDPWIRFVDVAQSGLTKANFPFRRLPAPPGSSLQKTASLVPAPARFWIERLVRLEERGASKEEAYLDLDMLEGEAAQGEGFTSLSNDTKREAAGAAPKISDDGALRSISDPAGATPKALDTRFRIVYRIYALGSHEEALLTILQNAPQGYIWAPPYQQNAGAVVPGDSLMLRLAADANDLPILPPPRVDLENVSYLRADSTVDTRSIQLTLQSLGRAFADSTVREVWFVEVDLPAVPKSAIIPQPVDAAPDHPGAGRTDTTGVETAKPAVTVYTGGKVDYLLDVHTNTGGAVIDRVPPGMKPVAVDSLATVSGDTIRWALPLEAGHKAYRLWTRMEANTDTTVNVLNKARLWEQDRQSNQLIPGPEDSADVTIKPLPAWTVTSKASPETVFVAVEKTTLENLGADSFISGSAVLTDVVQAQLFRVRDRLLSAPTQNIIITGHTDSNPINTPQYPNNFVLSMARANALRQWLIAAGIDSNRIIPRGFGPTKPVASNKTADGRRQNRRVELELVETVVDRVPYKSEITRTTTVSYHGAETLSQVEVVDSLGMNTTYLPDSATSMPLVSPGMLRWLLNDVRPGDAFTVTYKIEASGVASGNIPFRIPTVVSFSLPDGQWITNAPVTGKDVILMPKVDEEMPGQREDEGGARE